MAEKTVDVTTGEVNVTYKNLPMELERPQVEESKSYIFIIAAVLIGTAIVLLLVRFRGYRLWKVWYFLSIFVCLTVAFAAFVHQFVAIGIALLVALWKTYRPNFIVHNLAEIFLYGGLAAIFVPILNLWSAMILLVAISIYDMIAVWQSKHMVKMAKFQTQSKVFAGLSIPYKLSMGKEKHAKKAKEKEEEGVVRSAILGGGDIGFPLLFAGVLLKTTGFLTVLIVPAFVSVALFLLLYFAKKDRFYPAMPFISIGCFVGYGVMWLVSML
ncbi:TPA: hypothetical protein HA265_03645 [Candidatus Woesearchaeota archaeon]|nr:hypothetical protein [Candidatus Woesearchaeota archaeon]